MNTLILLLALLGTNPHNDLLRDNVYAIELNHYYDGNGRLVFDQLVFWDLIDDDVRVVRGWRLYKSHRQTPIMNYTNGLYTCRWFDGDSLRSVSSINFYHTWTQYDPEVLNRDILPNQFRFDLSKHGDPDGRG